MRNGRIGLGGGLRVCFGRMGKTLGMRLNECSCAWIYQRML